MTSNTNADRVFAKPSGPPAGRRPIIILSATRGTSLIELIIATGVISVALLVGIPRMDRMTSALRLDSAAAEVAVVLRWARQQAGMRGHKVGLKFYPSAAGPISYALYADGDLDGVRTADIRSGVDPEVVPLQRLQHLGHDIRFGIPLDRQGRAPRAINSRRRIRRPEDPIRFNRSDIASFGRSGTATPGTVYLTDGYRVVAVRLLNRTGKVSIFRYNPATEAWK